MLSPGRTNLFVKEVAGLVDSHNLDPDLHHVYKLFYLTLPQGMHAQLSEYGIREFFDTLTEFAPDKEPIIKVARDNMMKKYELALKYSRDDFKEGRGHIGANLT